ncbi:MAG: glycosyl hydrolase [Chloroflexi bacterium]|nr:glycosyl hydrolase [Chloroflexota bacterium]|tara:strand:+ start:41529 stop:44642 length:3114 start_codon:yes stop_codon:yes gene_type:complete
MDYTINNKISTKELKWRSIGPFRGGRVVAVAGHPVEKNIFYFGACAGGVWKTIDGGNYWENISDGFFKTSSVGALAISNSNPDIIYAGMGEACIRSDVSYGDGVYKSNDGGNTWVHIGLEDTKHISRIRIHPNNPDLVYVAALGHAFGKNNDRGVFCSENGGKTWDKVLFKSDKAGAIDLSMDPNHPNILYAAIWETLRTPWSLISGGEDSGLYKSIDGGKSWINITRNINLGTNIIGRIGITTSPAKKDRVWAIIESENGGLFRSEDGGDNWICVNNSSIVKQRPFYHHHIFADPKDPEVIWTLPIQAWKSEDGGETFKMQGMPHSDNHDLWIDPEDTNRMIEGNDGGACVSYNGGISWSTIHNQPTSQFYHVAVDNQNPYRVYGTQQDNTAISVPSYSMKGAILWEDCYSVGPSESGYIAIDPNNSNIVYSGAIGSAPGGSNTLLKYDHKSGETRIIAVWPEISYGHGANKMKYRFQWTYPIVISPHNPKVLYVAGNKVFRSIDEGMSWEVISPDLTKNDAAKGGPGGEPISRDVSGAEVYCTIFAFNESILKEGLFWAGTDDGLVYISDDSGKTWNDITPPDLPEWTTISMIEPSKFNIGTAYLTGIRYKLDDYSPYLYKTENYGKSWKKLNTDILSEEFVRVIREDEKRQGLLYIGTEFNVFYSLDDGDSWQILGEGLPVSPIHDLVVKDDDIIVATHGRSFWILDNITFLQQLPLKFFKDNALFKPRAAKRTVPMLGVTSEVRIAEGINYQLALGVHVAYKNNYKEASSNRVYLDAGYNHTEGVEIFFYIQKNYSKFSLKVLDHLGKLIKEFNFNDEELKFKPGINRFVWDMRYEDSLSLSSIESMNLLGGSSSKGPIAIPGDYQVALNIDGKEYLQSFEIKSANNINVPIIDMRDQFELLIEIRDTISNTYESINEIRNVRLELVGIFSKSNLSEQNEQDYNGILEKLDYIEGELLPSWKNKGLGQMGEPLSRLVDALFNLDSTVASAEGRPTTQSYKVLNHLKLRIDKLLSDFKSLIAVEINNLKERINS